MNISENCPKIWDKNDLSHKIGQFFRSFFKDPKTIKLVILVVLSKPETVSMSFSENLVLLRLH